MYVYMHVCACMHVLYKTALEGEGGFGISTTICNVSTLILPAIFVNSAERYPDVVVTASTPIIVREGDKSAVAMVVGMQMRYDKFHEFFMNTTLRCPQKNGKCNLTCASSVSFQF